MPEASDAIAPKVFLVFFIGRSGSSWLTELCAGTGRLGRPGEIFDRSKGKPFSDLPLEQFVPLMVKRNTRGGVFGAELAWWHVRDTFGTMETLLAYFPAAAPVCLIREDIVLQSVSAVRKKQTKVGHTRRHSSDVLEQADAAFRYDAAAIRSDILMRLKHEQSFEAAFGRNHLHPLRLSYERNVRSPKGALDAIAGLIGEPPFDDVPGSAHTILRTAKSEAFAERFRRENRRFVSRIERERAPMIEKLANY